MTGLLDINDSPLVAAGAERVYTGVGSRTITPAIEMQMSYIAGKLAIKGFKLRSGGAPGSDTAFAAGADLRKGAKEIFLPWHGFNGIWDGIVFTGEPATRAAMIAAGLHPAWDKCTFAARKLHARNVPQVLGADLLSPSAFVVCWTKDGGPTGGTGMAIRVARANNLPVYNLFYREQANELQRKINKLDK